MPSLEIFPDPGLNLPLLCPLHWQVGSLPLVPSGEAWIAGRGGEIRSLGLTYTQYSI